MCSCFSNSVKDLCIEMLVFFFGRFQMLLRYCFFGKVNLFCIFCLVFQLFKRLHPFLILCSFIVLELYPGVLPLRAFTNCMQGYGRACNMHANSITCAWKLVHGINWEHNWELLIACPHIPLHFKKIKTTFTTAFLISNTVVPTPYSCSTALDPQSFATLSKVPGPFSRSISVWYSNISWPSNR